MAEGRRSAAAGRRRSPSHHGSELFAGPGAAVSEPAVSESTVPEPDLPKSELPKSAISESAVLESAVPESAEPGATVYESTVPESGLSTIWLVLQSRPRSRQTDDPARHVSNGAPESGSLVRP